MLSQVLIWLNIGLPIVGLCAAVAGLAVAFHRESRATEDAFETLALRDRLSDSASGAAMLLGSKAAAPETSESPLRHGVVT